MKYDLFTTDVWEFDFPYHVQFKKQISDFLQSDYAEDYLKWQAEQNPSLTSYGGNALWYEGEASIISFFELHTRRLLSKVEEVHDWESGKWKNFEQWLNVNQKGDFNPPHIHPGHHYSGCYYVNFPEDSGHIHFLDPRPQHRIASPDLPNRPDPPDSNTEESGNPYAVTNSYDSSVFTYKIKEGKIIIFPSWLMHYVDPNPNDSTRVSIAFNAKYISNYEYSEK